MMKHPSATTLALVILMVVGHIRPATAAESGIESDNKAMTTVRYGDFGAKGDGKTDDLNAIVKAHEYANQHRLPVLADDDATYYISGRNKTAIIETDTDFGSAKFIIDDRDVENRKANIFEVRSTLQPIKLPQVTSLQRDQQKLDLALPTRCLVVATDANVKHFIRFGNNQNHGSSQTDVFLVTRDGTVDPTTPILWDFQHVTNLVAHPIDDQTLTITGGHFTTIANAAESQYTYYARGIAVRRSNVVIDGLQHIITDEGDHGAPYGGFINVALAADVTVKNAVLSGHKTYQTIGSAGRPVSMGTYDISLNRAIHVAFIGCTQANDINDGRRWGIMGSNFCKNLCYEQCTLSRFDAHQGVFNAAVRDSTIGHAGINLIGGGTFLLENTTVLSRNLINLRGDYGSTWHGEIVIRNCTLRPSNGRPVTACLIVGSNSGQHDFGYTCYMPQSISIDRLAIDDTHHPDDYQGPAIFGNFNPRFADASYVQKYPYVITRQVIMNNVTTASGKPVRLSDNPFMFKDVIVKAQHEGEAKPAK